MAALVQTYPQQTSTVTTLESRPSGNMIPAQAQANQQYMAAQQAQRNFSGSGVYRGSNAPIQPYAFTSTPSLNNNGQWQQYGSGYRTSSSPAVPTQGMVHGHDASRSRHSGSASMSHAGYNHGMGTSKGGSRDDLAIPAARTNSQAPRPQSAYLAGTTTQQQMAFAQTPGTKTTPDRYRRPALQQQQTRQVSAPSGSGMATISHLYNAPEQKSASVRGRTPSYQGRPNSVYGAADDMQLNRQQTEDGKRLRRRSMHSLDSADYPKPLTPQEFSHSEESSRPDRRPTPKNNEKTLRMVSTLAPPVDNNMHARNGSAESLASSRSSHSRPSSSANRSVPTPTANPSSSSTSSNPDDGSLKQDYPKLVNIPPRSSSSDAAKRQSTPSPLSKPVTMATDTSPQKPPSSLGNAPQQASAQGAPTSTTANASSPAAQQLAAINQKSTRSKSKTSRLRRAFSFGSAADFKKAAGPDAAPSEASNAADPSRLHKDPTATDIYDAEQAAIVKKQEEGGIGNNIYGGRLFSNSTDNLSISSTASSASIMIRKMGRGMKKSTRNLVGLFRPKSVIGVPAADALAPEASQAAVSMITVEAERINVNADPRAQTGGGTGFPHLERNSLDISNTPSMVSERAGSSGTDSAGRKSIVGGDKERAEVLAAVRKGILKHNNNRSASPARERISNFELPAIPSIADSPISTAPSTPNDEAQGHKRSGSVAIGTEDYFMTALRLRQDSKSAPGTPSGSAKRNATFSPRIIFHDTWPSGEYDRRGDIATCNRLTPMLAQQIKEELNTFKMVCRH
ncbi:protein BNI4 [Colletotrichum spaethianum]|uniref:Protein BNI4 n=1 Tax=Colletotrichum spaethianum TaxID=700344 RepID=A0AA37L907_9PEZI|nr:protein BNI4 [Colletotrichum spaethianum]GKT44057.1 protein BNI4 [Colletotrichum spaethianum]